MKNFFKNKAIVYRACPHLEKESLVWLTLSNGVVFTIVKNGTNRWHLHSNDLEKNIVSGNFFENYLNPLKLDKSENRYILAGKSGGWVSFGEGLNVFENISPTSWGYNGSKTVVLSDGYASFRVRDSAISITSKRNTLKSVDLKYPLLSPIQLGLMQDNLLAVYRSGDSTIVEFFDKNFLHIKEFSVEGVVAKVSLLKSKMVFSLPNKTAFLLDLLSNKTHPLMLQDDYKEIYQEGNFLITLLNSGLIHVYSATTGLKILSIRSSSENAPRALHFWKNYMAVISHLNQIEIWSLKTFTLVGKLRTPEKPVEITFEEDTLVCLLQNGDVLVWKSTEAEFSRIQEPDRSQNLPLFAAEENL